MQSCSCSFRAGSHGGIVGRLEDSTGAIYLQGPGFDMVHSLYAMDGEILALALVGEAYVTVVPCLRMGCSGSRSFRNLFVCLPLELESLDFLGSNMNLGRMQLFPR